MNKQRWRKGESSFSLSFLVEGVELKFTCLQENISQHLSDLALQANLSQQKILLFIIMSAPVKVVPLWSWGASQCYSLFVPLLFFKACFICSFLDYQPLTSSGGYVYPDWAYRLGWVMALSSVVPVPIWAVVKICLTEGTLRQVRAPKHPTYYFYSALLFKYFILPPAINNIVWICLSFVHIITLWSISDWRSCGILLNILSFPRVSKNSP